jgi:hypothetical protein
MWEALAFSPNSRWLAVCDHGGILAVIDLDSLRTAANPLPRLSGEPQPVTLLWPTPDTILFCRHDGLQEKWCPLEAEQPLRGQGFSLLPCLEHAAVGP